MGHHNTHHSHHQTTAGAAATDGFSQRVNSPRFSGPMTRRAQSFKRNGNNTSTQNSNFTSSTGTSHHEIEVLNSPRSEQLGGGNSVVPGGDGSESKLNRHHRTHQPKKSVISVGGGVGSGNIGLGLGKKKLGQWMFFVFCGGCLFLGILKICVNGWFGSAMDGFGSDQDFTDSSISHPNLRDQSSCDHRDWESKKDVGNGGNDVERTLMMVASGVVGNQNSMIDLTGIWAKPNSVNFSQCIDRAKSQKKLDINTNGYLLINANGGLNQMRFGSADM